MYRSTLPCYHNIIVAKLCHYRIFTACLIQYSLCFAVDYHIAVGCFWNEIAKYKKMEAGKQAIHEIVDRIVACCIRMDVDVDC